MSNTTTQPAQQPLTDEQSKLVEDHRALAASIARGFIGRGIDADDLVSIAHLALVRAARNFDTAGEAPFAAYGASWVRHCIMHELHAMVCDRAACPSSQQKLLSTARRAARSFALRHGREPHAAELAEVLEITTDRAASLLGLLHAHKSSISDTPKGDSDAKAMDLPQPRQESPTETLAQNESRRMLSAALKSLPPTQAEAVSRRFGLGGCAVQSIQDVAAGLGVSVGQAQQLIRNALTALGTSLRPLAT
ncbi:MAG: sigma-70 family RNA polymerase sigma factor [Phycisphaerales bacterium]